MRGVWELCANCSFSCSDCSFGHGQWIICCGDHVFSCLLLMNLLIDEEYFLCLFLVWRLILKRRWSLKSWLTALSRWRFKDTYVCESVSWSLFCRRVALLPSFRSTCKCLWDWSSPTTDKHTVLGFSIELWVIFSQKGPSFLSKVDVFIPLTQAPASGYQC